MPKLRKKQREFVKHYVANGENATQAVIDAGYDVAHRGVAEVIGYENLRKPQIAEAVELKQKSIADSIPDSLLIEKHTALLYKMDEDGSPDTQAVAKGLEMAYKLKGSYAAEKLLNLNLSVDVVDDEAIEKLASLINNKAKDDLYQGADQSGDGATTDTLDQEV